MLFAGPGILCILCVFIERTDGLVESMPNLPKELQDNFDTSYHIGDLNTNTGNNVFWGCVENYMSQFIKQENLHMPTDMQTKIKANIKKFMRPIMYPSRHRQKRQTQARIRYEIRAMPPGALQRYFQAVNAMKRDVIVAARGGRRALTMYDMLASLHTGALLSRAHRGPAFLAWHRIFLWIYESYLRTYVPGVTVPYWGSVLDSEMRDPTQSVLYTSEFFGSGSGTVDGPFVEWPALNPDTVFFRNLDPTVDVISYQQYDAVMRKRRNWQIMEPTAEADSQFESFHDQNHIHLGGSMRSLNTAVRDPMFFSHHCHVDKIWEDFRIQQVRNRIAPHLDYPWQESLPEFRRGHSPRGRTGFIVVTGARPNGRLITSNIYNWSNMVGYSQVWFDLVQYAPIPTCTGQNTCRRNRYLRCNRNNRCSSRSAQELRIGGARRKRAILSAEGTCQRKPFISDNKYSFIDNHISTSASTPSVSPNVNKWVYIPVSIIAKRNPSYDHFTDYSLYKGHPYLTGLKNSMINAGKLHCYDACKKNQDSVGRIKIMSYGLNYYGYNEEYAIIDNRFGMSKTSGFVPVKDPSGGVSEAMIAVVDSCGRVCRPYCKSHGSAMTKSTGAIRVTSQSPQQYYKSYGEATLNSWTIDSQDACPKLDEIHLPIHFYCEYTENWIWNAPNTTKSAPPTGFLDENLLNRSPVPHTSIRGSMAPDPSPRTRVGRPTGRSNTGGSRECVVAKGVCTIGVPCSPCTNWGTKSCVEGGKLALCINGKYSITTGIAM